MPITDGEWASIQALIEKKVADKGEPFVTDKVIKRDPDQRVIWTKDFGDEPIPIVDFNNSIRSFDTTPSGMTVRTLEGHADVPQIGDTVLIARELGTRRLPRCLGVIGNNAIVPSEKAIDPPASSQVIPPGTITTPMQAASFKANDADKLDGLDSIDLQRDWVKIGVWAATDCVFGLDNCLSKFGMTKFDQYSSYHDVWEYFLSGYIGPGTDGWMTLVPNMGHAAGFTVSDGAYWDGAVHGSFATPVGGQSLGILHTNWAADMFVTARGQITLEAGNGIAWHTGHFTAKPQGLAYVMSCKVGGYCAITGPVTTMRFYPAPKSFYGTYAMRPITI